MAVSIKIVSRVKPYIKVITKSALRKWGYIFGTIEDQEDLVAYVASKGVHAGGTTGQVLSKLLISIMILSGLTQQLEVGPLHR